MPIRTVKPTSPGRRFQALQTTEDITASKPLKALTEPLHKSGGRNNTGELTSWWRGGGHKRAYRIIDFKRDKHGIPAKVTTIEYDPNRSARIALLAYADGERRYILQPAGVKVGDSVLSGDAVDILPGNALQLKNIPLGTQVHNVELKPGKGGQLARSAGAGVQVVGQGRRLRHAAHAVERSALRQRGVLRDGRPGRQSRARERVDRQGRPQPLAGLEAAQPRRRDEPGRPPARAVVKARPRAAVTR
jgi:large subunit ribosomal protein L2